MNKEIIKAMNKKEKKYPVRKWWSKNGYKVMRVIFFPVWICEVIHEKTNEWLNSRNSWNEARAKAILDYYIPRRAEWDEEDKSFFFFDNGYGWGKLSNRYLKRKDRRFFRVNKYNIRRYLIDTFELDGFTKREGDCRNGWTELSFEQI